MANGPRIVDRGARDELGETLDVEFRRQGITRDPLGRQLVAPSTLLPETQTEIARGVVNPSPQRLLSMATSGNPNVVRAAQSINYRNMTTPRAAAPLPQRRFVDVPPPPQRPELDDPEFVAARDADQAARIEQINTERAAFNERRGLSPGDKGYRLTVEQERQRREFHRDTVSRKLTERARARRSAAFREANPIQMTGTIDNPTPFPGDAASARNFANSLTDGEVYEVEGETKRWNAEQGKFEVAKSFEEEVDDLMAFSRGEKQYPRYQPSEEAFNQAEKLRAIEEATQKRRKTEAEIRDIEARTAGRTARGGVNRAAAMEPLIADLKGSIEAGEAELKRINRELDRVSNPLNIEIEPEDRERLLPELQAQQVQISNGVMMQRQRLIDAQAKQRSLRADPTGLSYAEGVLNSLGIEGRDKDELLAMRNQNPEADAVMPDMAAEALLETLLMMGYNEDEIRSVAPEIEEALGWSVGGQNEQS